MNLTPSVLPSLCHLQAGLEVGAGLEVASTWKPRVLEELLSGTTAKLHLSKTAQCKAVLWYF